MSIANNCSWSSVYWVIILQCILLIHVYCFIVLCVLLFYLLKLTYRWLEISRYFPLHKSELLVWFSLEADVLLLKLLLTQYITNQSASFMLCIGL